MPINETQTNVLPSSGYVYVAPPRSFVYVGGPYRAIGSNNHNFIDYAAIDTHINVAREWAGKLAGQGIPFFCPHLNSAHFEVIRPDVQPEFWLEMDLVIMRYASHLLLLPDWKKSTGTLIEKGLMTEAGKPVYTYRMFDKLIEDWRKNG